MNTKTLSDNSNRGAVWNARFILIVTTLLYMANYMDRQVLSIVLEPMKLDLGLTDTQVGFIQTGFLLSIGLCSFPISFLLDRWSRKKAIGIMALIWSGATFLTGMGRNFAGIFIPRLATGVGEAGFSAGGVSMITASYPEKSRGRVLGIFNAAIPLGGALGVILGGYLSANHGGWRVPFYFFAIPGIILGVAAFFLKDYRTGDSGSANDSNTGITGRAIELLKIPTLRWVYAAYTMHVIMSYSILVWLPAFVMRAFSIKEDTAGMFMGAVAITAIFAAPLGGWITDLWQKRNPRGRSYMPALVNSLAALTGILAIVFGLKIIWFGIVMGILYAIFSVAGIPAIHAMTQEVVRPELKSMSFGLAAFLVYVMGGGWAPVLVGALSDRLGSGVHGLEVSLIIALCFGFLAGLFFFISSRHYPEDSLEYRDALPIE